MLEGMHRISVIALVDLAVKIEDIVEKFYEKATQVCTNDNLKKALTAIAAQEANHKTKFTEFLDRARMEAESIEKTRKMVSVEEVLSSYFPKLNAKVQRILSIDEDVAEAEQVAKDPLRFIELACFIEETAAELYESLSRHLMNHQLRKIAEELVNEERSHLKSLLAVKAKLEKAIARKRDENQSS